MRQGKKPILTTLLCLLLALSLSSAVAALADDAAEPPATQAVEGYTMIVEAAKAKGAGVEGTLFDYNLKHGNVSENNIVAFTEAETASSGDGKGWLGVENAFADWGERGKYQLGSINNEGILFEIVANENLTLQIEKTMGDIGWPDPGELTIYGKAGTQGILLKRVTFDAEIAKDKSVYGGTFPMQAGETLYWQFKFEWSGEVRNVQGPPSFTATASQSDVGVLGALENAKADCKEKFAAFIVDYQEEYFSPENWAIVAEKIGGFDAAVDALTTIAEVEAYYNTIVSELAAIKPSLDVYKTRAVAALAAYIDTLGRDKYNADGIAALESIVETFTSAVTAADVDSADKVDALLSAAKEEMRAVAVKPDVRANELQALLEDKINRLKNAEIYTFSADDLATIDAALETYKAGKETFADNAAAEAAYTAACAAIDACIPQRELVHIYDAVSRTIVNDYGDVGFTLIDVGLFYGSVEDPKRFTHHEGDGSGNAADMLIEGKTAIKRWQIEADVGKAVVIKATAKQNVKLSLTHRATEWENGIVWSTHTAFRFMAIDDAGTPFVLKKTPVASTMPENHYAISVHLQAGDSFYIEYYTNNEFGSLDFQPDLTANTTEYNADERPDYQAMRDMQTRKDELCDALDAYFAALSEDDFSMGNWERLKALLQEAKTAIGEAQDATALEQVYAKADADIKAVPTVAQESAALETYKAEKLAELNAYVAALARKSYTDEEWAAVEAAVDAFETALAACSTKTKVDVAFAAAKYNIDEVTPSAKGCGCGGAVGAASGAAGLVLPAVAFVAFAKRRACKKR